MATYAGYEAPGTYGTTAAATAKPKRRRVVNCVVLEEDLPVEAYYGTEGKINDPLRSTTCMSHHIMSRIEDDVRRAQMRQSNPDSAIPSKGDDYDQEATRAVEEYRTTQQLPRGTNVVAAALYNPQRTDLVLPALAPPSSRSRRNSDSTSQHPSRGNSTATSPANQGRRPGPGTSARRPPQHSRSPSRLSHQPGAPRSPSTSRPHRGSNNKSPSASTSSSPQPRLPAGGRLQPLGKDATAGTAQPSGGFRDDGWAVLHGGHHAKASKQLFLEPASFEAKEGATSADVERQRRLRLAEELAKQMDAEASQ